jgi:hypothetical protein
LEVSEGHVKSTPSALLSARPSGVSEAAEGHAKGVEELMMDVQREVSAKVSASMRFKLGLLTWFCNNLRARCHSEVLARCTPLIDIL